MQPGLAWISNPYLAKIVTALIIILTGFIVGKISSKLALRMLQAVELNRIIHKTGITFKAAEAFSESLKLLFYFMSVIYAMMALGIGLIAFYLLLAIIAAIILIIVLNMREVFPSIVAWLSIRKRIRDGDMLNGSNYSGRINHIHLTYVEIEGRNGETIALPHSLVKKQIN